MKKSILSFLLLFYLMSVSLAQKNIYQVCSPDHKLVLTLSIVDPGGVLQYRIDYEGEAVVLPSKVGIICDARKYQSQDYTITKAKVQGVDWATNVSMLKITESSKDSLWKPLYGERDRIRDHYNEKTFFLKNQEAMNLDMRLTIRAYNEGIAFKHSFYETSKVYGLPPHHITGETTEYSFAVGTNAWFTPFAQSEHRLTPISLIKGESDRPLTLELSNGLFACLTEAQMVDYSRTKFCLSEEKPNTLVGSMYGCVDSYPPFSTPWRVVMVAKTPGELLQNNDLILNLNKPCEITNTSWIKPGKIMRVMDISTEGAKRTIDFAVQRNMQYVDLTFWNGDDLTYNATKVDVAARHHSTGLDMHEVLRYAKLKGIGVWIYVNQRPLANQIDSLLPLYHSWGIKGIKFGFVHVGSHRWTTWLHEAIKKCARFEIMADIHDEYRPTGFSRTYPNLLTQEGIRGNEEMPEATNSTILPFTRLIAGPADNTFCYYTADQISAMGVRRLKTTLGHQLALPVILYSPLQYLFWYDKPRDYKGEKEIEFWDQMPTVWNDTKVLNGEIGKYVTIARRSGDQWFVGSVTNINPRELKLSLSFLDKTKKYEAIIYSDKPDLNTRTNIGVEVIRVDSKTELVVKLLASGGQAMLIKPVK